MSGKKFGISVVISGVDRVTNVVGKVARSVAKFHMTAASRLRAAGDQFGLPRLTQAAGKAGSALGDLSRRAALVGGGVAAGVTAATASVVAMVAKVVDASSSIQDLHEQTGISTDSLQEWQFAATQSGASAEEFGKSMQIFSSKLGKSADGRGLSKVLDGLGVKFKGKKAEDLIPDIADKLAQIKDPAKQAAVAQELFGKAGIKLLPALKGGSKGLAEFAAEAKRLGIVVDGKAIAANEEFGDNLDKLKLSLFGAANAATTGLMPAINELVKKLTKFVTDHQPKIKAFFDKFGEGLPVTIENLKKLFGELTTKLDPLIKAVESVVKEFGLANTFIGVAALVVAAIVAPIVTATIALFGLTAAVARTAVAMLRHLIPASVRSIFTMKAFRLGVLAASLFMTGTLMPALAVAGGAFKAFGTAIVTTPGIGWILLVIGLIATGVYLIYENWDKIGPWFSKLWEGIKTTASEAWEWLKELFSNMWSHIESGLPDWVKELFGGNGGANVTINGPSGQPMGAANTAAGIAQAQKSQTSVTVDFQNMPRGVRTQADSKGPGQFELNQGFASAY